MVLAVVVAGKSQFFSIWTYCLSGLSLSHQRMTSVAMFIVRSTYWRSGPIIIYIYQLD